jgi:hypothetical protein
MLGWIYQMSSSLPCPLTFCVIFLWYVFPSVPSVLRSQNSEHICRRGNSPAGWRSAERELGFHLVPKYFWWLNCPTQIIGLTSLLKCIDYTSVKGSHSANKKTKCWIQQRSKGPTKGTSGLAHRTVRCATGQCPVHHRTCPVHQRTPTQTRHLREFPEALAL